MIITVTGKPCSGKGTASKLFAKKYKFDYICTGDMFRAIANELGFKSVLEFQQQGDIESADKMVDRQTAELGKKHADENIIIDSRLAWHFIPNSFKVFIDIDWDTAAERLIEAGREHEQASNLEQAKELLETRWQVENERYSRIYNTNNLNLCKYDLIISSKDKKPEHIAKEIYKAYKNFIKSKKNNKN